MKVKQVKKQLKYQDSVLGMAMKQKVRKDQKLFCHIVLYLLEVHGWGGGCTCYIIATTAKM